MNPQRMELVCPAGGLPALRTAVDHGADAVYLSLRGETNARNFPGLNFDRKALAKGIAYAHGKGTKVYMALNTYPQPDIWKAATEAVDAAAVEGVDAVILADLGLMRHAADNHPDLTLHLSVQGSATTAEALNFYHDRYGVRRAVLPRVLSLSQVAQVIERTKVDIEVFGFGSLCVMVEGRCMLSSYATGDSPNTKGACSPAHSVRWIETDRGREARLNGVLIDTFREGESAGYPVICKGRYHVGDGQDTVYAIEEPTSLSTLDILPDLLKAGVKAIKLEGRQRSPAYVGKATQVMRQALDAVHANPDNYKPKPEWAEQLAGMSEGRTQTLGALHRAWQ
ncbi:peptidase U32 family protein [Ectothiorhodospira sp. BSL-9]|uniref:ubiquinone anaerobic biosynthesis protein UbiU n=1 Tax=Ectothiorhodospira sp. BSL-9 TaxID=1442136 RepID=UPI0007B44D59|nr:peptidase U32 family protein [Ectothiorhodospira sp. BSL-9]ANB01484.1 protease [Ectothiorhodospira sp. BSL-9]TVQ72536.1 MAG: U32 family peptidase [Chromatiaceae bacterium]